MLYRYLLIFVISQLFLVQCIQKNKTSTNSIANTYKASNSTEIAEDINISDPLTHINNPEVVDTMISNIIDFKLGDDIKLDSPKRFLQISILFTLVQNSNYHYIAKKNNKDDEKISKYMGDKRISFYKKLGISEEEYINYGIRNSELIQEYLATDTNMANIYEIIQAQVTD